MNSLRHLICGIDGSDPARRAAATALRLADRLGDRLVLVHVTPARPPMLAASLPVGAHSVGIADIHDLNRIEAEDAFASVEPDGRARSTVRSSGQTPHAKLNAGSRAPRQKIAVTGDGPIIPFFTRPHASAKRTWKLKARAADDPAFRLAARY
jgi:nucleotide-binding universal stress UspA family protein